MKNLGKIVLFILLAPCIYANVDVSVSSNVVEQGNEVVLAISGDTIDESPSITTLCGVDVSSTSQNSSVAIINGSYSKKVTYQYAFTPTKSCTIQPITVKSNARDVVSKAIKIRVIPHKQNPNADFILELHSDKKSLYVGEPMKVTLLFKQKRDAQALDSRFEAPAFKNFWKKTETKPKRYQDGLFNITQIEYVLAPQKEGSFEISPAKLSIATRDNRRDAWGQFFASMKWKSYFSNSLKIDVKALPSGVDLIGDFKMSLHVKKKEANADEAVNVTLVIVGSGNFEDIPSMKPNIADVTTYDEEAKISEGVEDGKNIGRWSQKFAFVADSNFTIPSFTLQYFDLKSKQIKTIETKEIEVVIHSKQSVKREDSLHDSVVIQRSRDGEVVQKKDTESVTLNYALLVVVALVSAIIGALLTKLPLNRVVNKNNHKELRVSHKDLRSVLTFLFAYKSDEKVASMIEKIEKKLYNGENVVIDTKELKELIKKYSS